MTVHELKQASEDVFINLQRSDLTLNLLNIGFEALMALSSVDFEVSQTCGELKKEENTNETRYSGMIGSGNRSNLKLLKINADNGDLKIFCK